MKIIVLVFITAFSFYLTGCGSSKRVVVVEKKLPAWYLNPPRSNSHTLYALGEGQNKREAIDNALTLLASTLSVSVSSTFEAKSVVKEGREESSEATYVNQTKSEVKKIRLTNYKILNTAQLGFKHIAVLIEADKRELFLGLQNALQQKFMFLDNEEKRMQNANALQQLSFYKKALQQLEDVPNTLAVMKVLQADFDPAGYLQKINTYKEKYNSLHSRITFSIYADPNAVILKKPLAKGLSSAGFRLQKQYDRYHFSIRVQAAIEKAEAYGFSIARAEITLRTQDYKNNIIATNVIHIDGQSSQGYAIALQNLSKKLDKIIQKQGVLKVLLINI